MIQDDIVAQLLALAPAGTRRKTEFLRWTNGIQYIEIAIDSDGNASYSTNLPTVGKGMSWPKVDDRYVADLKAALQTLNG